MSQEFGATIRASRVAAGLGQEQLADRAGVSVRWLRNLERGRIRRPRPAQLARLITALRLPESEAQRLRADLADVVSRSDQVWIGVLGPLLVHRSGAPVALGARKQRLLLSVLGAQPGQVVPVDELVDLLWSGSPPRTARDLVHTYVARLRRQLGLVARDPRLGIVATAGGYRLMADAGSLDLLRFEELVGRASAEPDPRRAIDLYARAMGCWRGPMLADTRADLPVLPGVTAVHQARLAVAVTFADLALDLGRHTDSERVLRPLCDIEPLHEGIHARLMLALAAGGRRGDSLRVFADVRQRLVDELGIRPGQELQSAHLWVLREEATAPERAETSATTAVAADTNGRRVSPAQLPADVSAFTGREAELALLDRLLLAAGGKDADRLDPPMPICLVSGSGGVGKTALAVRWAHHARRHFPDGQLYLNLRGYSPQPPMPPGEALTRMLNALGVTGTDIPLDEDDRTARYRTAIADRRILVLLDNAASAEQVRPLLPGTATAVVLVTSRDSLAGLVAGEGAHRLELDRLPLPDALVLLHRLAPEQVDAEPDATAVLAGLCARLPLALRVAAEQAASRNDSCLTELTTELSARARRLDLLDIDGDPRTAVRTVFSWSYQYLAATAARAFRLLSLHPGTDIDAPAAAELLDTHLHEARRLLEILARAHLVETTLPGRYGMHDLLRAYAAELAREDGDGELRAALGRLFDYYLVGAAAAMDTLYPATAHQRPRIPVPDGFTPSLDQPGAAQSWLDTHRATLATVCAHAAAHGWPAHAVHLAETLFRYHDTGGHYTDMLAVQAQALKAANALGDRDARARALTGLATGNAMLGQYQRAIEQHTQALNTFRATGERRGQARALGNLSVTHYKLGEYESAADHNRQALALYREVDDRVGAAGTLTNLGDVYLQQGRFEQAAAVSQEALSLHRELGYPVGEILTLGNLGQIRARQGRHDMAEDHLLLALDLSRRFAYRDGEAEALTDLGDLHLTLGRHKPAAEHHDAALAIFGAIGSRYGQARALNGLGEAALLAGFPEDAVNHHAAALEIAENGGERSLQARAHAGLARAHSSLGRSDLSWHHRQQARALGSDDRDPATQPSG